MRTREAKMIDYDVPKEDESKLDTYCRSPDPEIKLILFGCAISKAPGMEIVIYESLTAKDPKEAGYSVFYEKAGTFRPRPMIFTDIGEKSKQSFITG